MKEVLREKKIDIIGLSIIVFPLLLCGLLLSWRDQALFKRELQTLPILRGFRKIFGAYHLRSNGYDEIYATKLGEDTTPEELYYSLVDILKANAWKPVIETPVRKFPMVMGKKIKGKEGHRFHLPHLPNSSEEYEVKKWVEVWIVPFMVKTVNGQGLVLSADIWEERGFVYLRLSIGSINTGFGWRLF